MTQNADFNQIGNSVFENVYIYGDLFYEFDTHTFENITINNDLSIGGTSFFRGEATFADDVNIYGNLSVDFLTVPKRFRIGLGGTALNADLEKYGGNIGIANTIPYERLHINTSESSFLVSAGGTVGIGTTNIFGGWTVDNTQFSETNQGPLKLEVDGSAHIARNIYDSVGSPGLEGYWLKRDGSGIRWQPTPPSLTQDGIKLLDEKNYIPISAGVAQTFTELNFMQRNSLGKGVDTLVPTPQSDIAPGTGLATIFTSDLWGVEGDFVGLNTGIYRMTNVGIGTTLPTTQFQVGIGSSATFSVTGLGSVGIGTTDPLLGLDVHKDSYFRQHVSVAGTSYFVNTTNAIDSTDGAIRISGGVGIAKSVFIAGETRIEKDTDSTLQTEGALVITGGTGIGKNLYVGALARVLSGETSDSASSGALVVTGGTGIGENLYVGALARVLSSQSSTTASSGALVVTGGTGIGENLYVGALARVLSSESSTGTANGALVVTGGVGIGEKLNIQGITKVHSGQASTGSANGALIVTGGVGIGEKLNVADITTIEKDTDSDAADTGALIVTGGVGIGKDLNIGSDLVVEATSTLKGNVELDAQLIDLNGDTGVSAAKTDYRLASVGSGVSWRPSGVETENAIWVSMDGLDDNSGLLEGDAKRTIGAAASIAQTGDTIIVRSGVYKENNPIGLRTEVSVSGEDLRLVTVVPLNQDADVFQVRAGCLIQNLNFAGETSSTNHPNCGAVAFPPTTAGVSAGIASQASTGYKELGPANQGPDRVDPTKGGRWRSPYVRNCTNFMTGSIGMRIDGDFVNAAFTGTNDLGQDLKSMVCDSFTQYNEAGIGVSLTNNSYAQLVSIFTIGCEIAIFAGTGGQCDLTNSNSSFGNVGLKADGYGDIEFTGSTFGSYIAGSDDFVVNNVRDTSDGVRKPFDGQGGYFLINMDDYNDTSATGIVTGPLKLVRGFTITDGGAGYNEGAPPVVTINEDPLGPEAILPEFSANVSSAGTITSIDVIASGRNYLPDQNLTVNFSGGGGATATVNTDPILFTVDRATEPTNAGLTTVTFNEFVPYSVGAGVSMEFVRLSRIITSSHSFEYVGAGTDINRANPFQGGEPIPENEIIAINGGQIPFTSTDQKGNFRIGDGLTIDQTTSTIRGRDFNRAIQAQLTPLILSLR